MNKINQSKKMREAILAAPLPMTAAEIEQIPDVLQWSRITHIKTRVMLERMSQRGLLVKDMTEHPIKFRLGRKENAIKRKNFQ